MAVKLHLDTQNSSDSNSNTNTSWKAQGFINVTIPTSDGLSMIKLGSIAIKGNTDRDKALLRYLAEDQGNINKLAGLMQFSYQPAGNGDSAAFMLPV